MVSGEAARAAHGQSSDDGPESCQRFPSRAAVVGIALVQREGEQGQQRMVLAWRRGADLAESARAWLALTQAIDTTAESL